MKNLLLASMLLLSGCMIEEETFVVIHQHPAACDIMDVRPDLSISGELYVDEIIR